MSDDREESRRAAILLVAFDAFANYGFKRTTMDDIARAAGVSRPALYLLYRNKADIFRALMLEMMDQMRQRVASCLNVNAPIVERVRLAIEEGIIRPHRDIRATAHGAALLDVTQEVSEDLVGAWMKVVEEEISLALERETTADRITFPSGLGPRPVASLLMDTVEGMKCRCDDIEQVAERVPNLLSLMLAPLIPR